MVISESSILCSSCSPILNHSLNKSYNFIIQSSQWQITGNDSKIDNMQINQIANIRRVCFRQVHQQNRFKVRES